MTMTMKPLFKIVSMVLLSVFCLSAWAEDTVRISQSDWLRLNERVEHLEQHLQMDSANYVAQPQNAVKQPRLTIGGYGEATFRRNFYSSNPGRYKLPEQYRGQQYGEFDLPHVCFYLSYDFGHGWRIGSEIEFEHGGTETAMETEGDEGLEYETEVERGGEVALEQLWVEKRFSPLAAIRAGMLVVPLGGVNAHHEPNQFFGAFRPEGDNTILPCTWHEIGVQFSGTYRWLSYTAQFLPGLQSNQFGSANWIHYGSASMFEYRPATTYAGLARLDFFPLYESSKASSLRLSLSGYCGTSFRNTAEPVNGTDYQHVRGLVSLGAFDWNYRGHGLVFRGSALYGHLGDAAAISTFNRSMPKNSNSRREHVASDAYSCGAELGYDFFTLNNKLHKKQQQLFLFARYDIYDAMARTETVRKYWAGRQKLSLGINYFPIPQIIVKAEYAHAWINKSPTVRYNDEPYLALSIAYCGMFKL